MERKEPFEYELTPTEISAGMRELMLTLKNIAGETLKHLDVVLNSRDSHQINVPDADATVSELQPNEVQQLLFQVTANGTVSLYVTVDGRQGDRELHWESPDTHIVVGLQVAELADFSAVTEPYPTLGTAVTLEATVRGIAFNQGLGLEFWADTPRQELISIAKMPTDPLPEGETKTYTTEFTPEESGIYTLHAYLYAGTQRIGHAIEYLSITR